MSQAKATVLSNIAPNTNLPSVCIRLLEAKAKKGLTFEQIGKFIGRDEMWVAAALYGQAKFSQHELKNVSDYLGIPTEDSLREIGDQWWPNRGQLGPMPPTDPVLYRLYEGVMVYGYPIKALVHEKCGDGIISMIDCKVHVDKKKDPKGDRIVLTFDGKFLPYATW